MVLRNNFAIELFEIKNIFLRYSFPKTNRTTFLISSCYIPDFESKGVLRAKLEKKNT